jgi:hypothetical protein
MNAVAVSFCVLCIKQAIAAFFNCFKRPEVEKLALIYTGSAGEAKVTTTTSTAAAADLVSVFKGTPMVMSKAARTAADALTAVFIVVDDIMPVMPRGPHLQRNRNDTNCSRQCGKKSGRFQYSLHKASTSLSNAIILSVSQVMLFRSIFFCLLLFRSIML